MIAIYKGEDTEFAGQEPFLIKINTPLDLSGYTAELKFGNVVKKFGTDEVGEKILRLSFSASDTLDFYPGKGYASVYVYDTEGRVAILKRFVIDVRFRRAEDATTNVEDIESAFQVFANIKAAIAELPLLSPTDGVDDIKDALNTLLNAARKRTEFPNIPKAALAHISSSAKVELLSCIRNLESLALNTIGDDSIALEDLRERLNEILIAFGGEKATNVNAKELTANIAQVVQCAKVINRILRLQNIF